MLVHDLSRGRAGSMRDGEICPRADSPEIAFVVGSVTAQAAGGTELPLLRLAFLENDPASEQMIRETALQAGFVVTKIASTSSLMTFVRDFPADVLILGTGLPDRDGAELLEPMRNLCPRMGVVVASADATVATAIEALRLGADDFLAKPFDREEMAEVLERAAHRVQFDQESRALRERLRTSRGMGQLVGTSAPMEKLYRILSKVACSTHPVLILGESGTGKEIIARSIHNAGPNASKPFVTIDCGALVPTLIESELFGHVKGAFTGANWAKEGLLASAKGGTVFLDEIGELPLELQAKLLRALQEKEVRPVGANHSVPIAARVLAATNRDLRDMVERGKFRKDLFFRLNVVNLKVPSLRDRKQDIPLLAQFFLERIERETGTRHRFSEQALRLIVNYEWPGNVRELQNAIERMCAISSGPVLHAIDLPTQLQDFRAHREHSLSPGTVGDAQAEGDGQIVPMADLEKNAILSTIRQLGGDKLLAARLLGIGKTTLYRKLKEYGVSEGADSLA